MMFDKLIREEIFNKIDLNIYNFEATYTSGSTYFKACDWKWVGISHTLTVDSGDVPFQISDNPLYDYMVEDLDVSNTTILKLANLHWYSGTFKETNTDFVYRSNDERNKLPMCWLSFTPTPRTTENTTENSIRFIHNVTMFFCASADFRTFTTENHMRNRIDYLNEYVNSFVDSIRRNKQYFDNPNGVENTRNYYPKFGSFTGENGRTIIDSQLSGIELNFVLNEKRKCKC